MLSSGRPLHPQLTRHRPKRLSSATMAWQTIGLRDWRMVAGKRSNGLRVSWKALHAPQIAPCIRSLCVATQNVCHRYIWPSLKTSCGVIVRRACCVAAGKQCQSLRVSGNEQCSAQGGPCIRS